MPLRSIEKVTLAFTSSLADMALRISAGVVDMDTAAELFEDVLRSQREGWAAYLSSIEDPRELVLANEAERQRQRAQALVIEALGLASGGRQRELEFLLRTRMFAVTDPLSRALDRVHGHNIERADRTFRFLDARFDLLSTIQTALFAVAAAVVTFVLLIGIRDLLVPLARLTGTIGRLSAGLLDRPVSGVGRKDEMGALALALESFRLSAIEMERLRLEEQAQRLAAERAQAQIERYSELIRNITDNAPAALFEAHVEAGSPDLRTGYRARFAFVGRAVERILGVSADAIMADPAARLRHIHPEDVGRLSAAVRGSIAHGRPYHAEFRVLIGSGERWVLSRGESRPGPKGGVTILGSYIDITEQKEQERRLAEVTAAAEASRKRLLYLSDALPGAIFQVRVDPDGERRFLFISRRAESLLGVPLAELRADYLSWRRHVRPEDLARFLANLHGNEADGAGGLLVFEFRVRLPQGERWLRSDALPGRAADGAVLWNGYWQDVTDLKNAEAALLAEKGRTESALTKLQQTQAQLVQAEKMAALAGLVAGVAHEINTPVGIAFTAASTLADEARRMKAIVEDRSAKRSDVTRFLALADETAALMETHCRNAADLIQSFKQVAVDQSSDDRRTFALGPYLDERSCPMEWCS